ncbi:glycosyltransferase family 25 protein [Zhongshania guokunii]|uniref:Glycosyltransferase family 25 protein n=1 Tax=Zhongshania guokunii TaxID=641783 RepID=A0ABV3U2M9_9GAMM
MSALAQLPTLVISLEPDTADVRDLLRKLAALGFKPQLFAAVDGRSAMPVLRAGESVDQASSLLRRRAILSNAEVGCFLSHARAIREAYAKGAQHLLLLEDDVEIRDGLAEVAEAILALPAEAEMVRLMGLKRRRRKVVASIAERWQLVRPLRGWCGTQGYIINRSGMEKFIRHASCMSQPIDGFYDCYWETGIRCYGIEPHVIAERQRPSSIAKPWGSMKPSRKTVLRWHVFKLARGLIMRRYRLRYLREFYPNQLPDPSIKFARSNP